MGCVADYYAQHPYGTSWQIYKLQLDGTDVSYNSTGTLGAGNIELKPYIYTIDISPNNSSYCSVSNSQILIPKGYQYTLSNNTLTAVGKTSTVSTKSITGYTTSFNGWSPSTTPVTVNSQQTVKANCTASVNSYTVTIARNNTSYGTVSSNSVSIPYGTTYSVSGSTLTFSNGTKVTASPTAATGYTTTFSGWSPSSGTITGATTITANFNRSINVCSITYDANGGVFGGSLANGKTTYTDTLRYDSVGYQDTDGMGDANGGTYAATKTGYTPKPGAEWIKGTKTYNQSSKYKPTDFCPNLATKSESVTLKVNWKVNTCSITYDANGGVFGGSVANGKTTHTVTREYGNAGYPNSMPDANGGTYAATKSGYIPKKSAEWIKGTKTYNQDSGYKLTDFCPNLATKSESVTLKVNWEALTLTIEPHKIANPKKDGPTASACSGYTGQNYLFIFYLNSNDTIASGKMCYSKSNTTTPTSYCANYSKGACTNTKAGYAWYKGSNEWFFYRSSSYVYAYAKTTRGKAASKFQG